MSAADRRAWGVAAALTLVLVLLAFARPLDHDESQYVAAAELARHGLVYRDFAYLQTPLQPLLFAPLAALFGRLAYLGLRLVNALLGVGTVALVHRGCRAAGADRRTALIAAAGFACCDIFLFSAAVARNDMLPAALFAGAVVLMVRQVRGTGSAAIAAAIGLLLSAATAAKLSYAVPAIAYGALTLVDRRHRPGWLIAGALPPAALVAWTWASAPAAFAFDVLRFPTAAPEQFYAAGRAWKLALWARGLDTLKFLALGPALLALILVVRDRRRDALAVLLDVMILAGLVAAILPAPTWRQYLLVMLPLLFVRLSLVPPPGKQGRRAGVVFALAGLAPSAVTLATSAAAGLPLVTAIRDGAALRSAFDRAGITGAVATLAPQFVPATGRPIDPRFTAGPFYFRSTGLLSPAEERSSHLVSRTTAPAALEADPPAAIVTGGEGARTSGDPRLADSLAAIAEASGWRRIPVAGTPFTLYVAPAPQARTASATRYGPAASARR